MNKRSSDSENVCSFFLERKKRLCRMKRAEGMTYCPHHSHLGSEKDEKKGSRIPCPYDSSHFCYEWKLQKHLKICNAREKEKPDYFKENINGEKHFSESSKASLNDATDEELLQLIQKIKAVYQSYDYALEKHMSLHPMVVKEMGDIDDGANSFKHMKQQASLLKIMQDFHLLSSGNCFVEFGAGKGQLMYWVVRCSEEKEKSSFILVDKCTQRHKSDNKFKGEDLHIERIRIDIQHLCLGLIPSIKKKLNKVVGVCKHLCGAATDLAINSLTKTLTIQDEKSVNHNALGLVMALCCYHRCTWHSYVGKKFMQDNGITEMDFRLMCCMASWSTCGLRKSKETHIDSSVPCETDETAQDKVLNRYVKLCLEHKEREEIGVMCKRIIDFGRLEYLKSLGYDVKIMKYVDSTVTLENVVLVAVCKENQ